MNVNAKVKGNIFEQQLVKYKKRKHCIRKESNVPRL
jgi:hypothetical protein